MRSYSERSLTPLVRSNRLRTRWKPIEGGVSKQSASGESPTGYAIMSTSTMVTEVPVVHCEDNLSAATATFQRVDFSEPRASNLNLGVAMHGTRKEAEELASERHTVCSFRNYVQSFPPAFQSLVLYAGYA